jgi:hypothetical protein
MAWMSWKKMRKARDKEGLGFRDLELFNLAMLAKQGWRLIQNPETLVAKIMRVKYYPNGNFIEADIGRNPSFAWHSIWNSKKLLLKGIIWRVGDGAKIKIWEDPWLPGPRPHLVRQPGCILGGQAKVSKLLNVNTNWWNTSLVQDVFSEEDAKLICSIGVCPHRGTNVIAWKFTSNGDFTIRSAYHLAMVKVEEGEASCSDTHLSRNSWKKI